MRRSEFLVSFFSASILLGTGRWLSLTEMFVPEKLMRRSLERLEGHDADSDFVIWMIREKREQSVLLTCPRGGEQRGVELDSDTLQVERIVEYPEKAFTHLRTHLRGVKGVKVYAVNQRIALEVV